MYSALRLFLSAFPPEQAHRLAMQLLEMRHKLIPAPPPPAAAAKTVMGLSFANPVGLAAGFDKNACHIDALATLGFGFIEVGGVTPLAQPGNAQPRIFRLPQAKALINRMGFNNIGADAVANNLAAAAYQGIIGVNIGKNAATPQEEAINDYISCLHTLYPHGDFFVLNISSPNTKNLRDWQRSDSLIQLLTAVTSERDKLADMHNRRAPLLVKIAPDIKDEDIKKIAAILLSCHTDGVVAVNTTTTRPPAVAAHKAGNEAGGLSGEPLRKRATQVIACLRSVLPENIAIIGVGGIGSVADAQEKLAAGADLIQLYTGLIYSGATLPMDIINTLRAPA